jgi:hypothetical protein
VNIDTTVTAGDPTGVLTGTPSVTVISSYSLEYAAFRAVCDLQLTSLLGVGGDPEVIVAIEESPDGTTWTNLCVFGPFAGGTNVWDGSGGGSINDGGYFTGTTTPPYGYRVGDSQVINIIGQAVGPYFRATIGTSLNGASSLSTTLGVAMAIQ